MASSPGVMARLRPLASFRGPSRVLHLTWFAFFLTFVVWFNFAPFANTIASDLGLTTGQKQTLALCNVALTVPARIFIGMALDRWGPRRVYTFILAFAAIPNTAFALSSSFGALVLSRLALSVVGAGFVVGIRLVSEWFPPRDLGTVEGVYGGWGNFGSAAAAFTLPALAGVVGGWRVAIGLTGVLTALYAIVFYRGVTDTPEGVGYAKPRRQGALEVTSPGAVWGLAALTVPVNLVLGVIAWRIWRQDVIGDAAFVAVLVVMGALLVIQEIAVFRVNAPARAGAYEPADRYPLRSVAVLCLAYFTTFGSELAVVSMLPTFFADTWQLGPAAAGLAASAFAFTNLVARPGGGLLSDVMGSRSKTLRMLLVGTIAGFGVMAFMDGSWPWQAAVGLILVSSLFVQGGNGAVYAIVPLIRKRVSGQVAGMAGAYGNVGAILFLTAGIFVPATTVFAIVAVTAAVASLVSLFLVEPANAFSADLLTEPSTAASPSSEPAPVPTPVVGARPRLAPAVGD